ncbi:MAG TPA: Stk1 family PASTA domain-containing Ser/Thr kinase [Solirubrobacteraceae bacterium]|nr:Stk1 family PASTA domain-containing Ser/Thr kinase [Solirubrobacteraceae bacterium]
MTELAPGTVVDGRYRIVSRLGSGGMAEVFLAHDQQLGRNVALKLLHRRFAEDPGFVERFRREAQAAAGLQHPNVVGVYDRGNYDGTYYIAMEHLPGRSLKQLIRQEAPVDPIRAIDITLQILKAARFAHRHGVIHRDLKPHNAIVDESDHVKVTDFGIARAGASDMTETGSIMGTAQYLSPEQAQGHAVSETSDLYSVGVILYELLTGRVPFDAESAVTIALKHLSEPPTAPTQLNPAIPPALEAVVLWALNKNPADRPRNADELIEALQRARASILAGDPGQRTEAITAVGVGVAAAGVGLVDAPAAAPVPAAVVLPPPVPVADNGGPPDGSTDPEQERERRRRWLWLAALLALLALLGAGAAVYFLTRPAKVPVPNVIGKPINIARTILQNDGLLVSVVPEPSQQPAGHVIGEIPSGGTSVHSGSTVSLTVSTGPGDVAVPSTIVGDTLAQARKALRKSSLKVGNIIHRASGQFPAGQVINTSPQPGQSVAAGSSVTLFVSTGPAKVSVPNVTGENLGQAKSDLHAAGFDNVNATTQTSTAGPPGDVISQSPTPGTLVVPSSTTINLVVAKAPKSTPTKTVPNVKGQSASSAAGQLQSDGFTVVQKPRTVTNPSKNGVVLSQSPGGGTNAPKGSTVTLIVGQYTSPTSTTTTTSTSTTSTTSTTTPAG